MSVSSEELAELKALHQVSRKAKGVTPVGDPARIAGDEFCKRVLTMRDTRGVSLWDLSLALGLSKSAVYLKLKRRGMIGPLLESQTNYKGHPLDIEKRNAKLRTTQCKNGHPWTDENTIREGSSRRCRACRAEYWKTRNSGRPTP